MSLVRLVCHLDKEVIKHSVFIYNFSLRLHSLKKLSKNLLSAWSISKPLIVFSLDDSDRVKIFPWKSFCFLLYELNCFPDYNKPCFISSSMQSITLSDQLLLSKPKIGVTTFHCKVFFARVIIFYIDLYANKHTFYNI